MSLCSIRADRSDVCHAVLPWDAPFPLPAPGHQERAETQADDSALALSVGEAGEVVGRGRDACFSRLAGFRTLWARGLLTAQGGGVGHQSLEAEAQLTRCSHRLCES